MKLIVTCSLLIATLVGNAQNQHTIKYGDDKTYSFSGKKINTFAEYDEMAKGLSNNDNYFDITPDSLIIHTVYKTDNSIHTTIARRAIAANDIVIFIDQNKLLPVGTTVKIVTLKIKSKLPNKVQLILQDYDATTSKKSSNIHLHFNVEDKKLAKQMLEVITDLVK